MALRPRLEWSASARTDLLAIIAYIADDNLQAAQDLKDEIEAKVSALLEHPQQYAQSKRAPGYRQITVRSHYLVFYRLLSVSTAPIIDIAAVVHARRLWPL